MTTIDSAFDTDGDFITRELPIEAELKLGLYVGALLNASEMPPEENATPEQDEAFNELAVAVAGYITAFRTTPDYLVATFDSIATTLHAATDEEDSE